MACNFGPVAASCEKGKTPHKKTEQERGSDGRQREYEGSKTRQPVDHGARNADRRGARGFFGPPRSHCCLRETDSDPTRFHPPTSNTRDGAGTWSRSMAGKSETRAPRIPRASGSWTRLGLQHRSSAQARNITSPCRRGCAAGWRSWSLTSWRRNRANFIANIILDGLAPTKHPRRQSDRAEAGDRQWRAEPDQGFAECLQRSCP